MKIECSVSELTSLQKTDEVLNLTTRVAELSGRTRELQTEAYATQETIHRLQTDLNASRREAQAAKQGGITSSQFEVLGRICGHELCGEFIRVLREGQKISAIKLYREMTHMGLKEAKDAVEVLSPPGGYY